jgi:hypothetical protein
VKVAMSARPSPLKSATIGSSPSTAKKSCHTLAVLRKAPAQFDFATCTSAVFSRLKLMMSSQPSPSTSPTAGMALPPANEMCQLVAFPNGLCPVDSATCTEGAAPRRKETMSSKPSPLKSPTIGTLAGVAEKVSSHLSPTPVNDPPVDSAT